MRCPPAHACLRHVRQYGLTKDAIVTAFEQPALKDLPIKAAHATLLDRGIYLASPSTLARVLKERAVRRIHKAKRKSALRPHLLATRPNQVWCWDIYAKEDGTLARNLFAAALRSEGVEPGQITVHSDNGRPMKSISLRTLFEKLCVTASYGRPHTSNDNAYAESLFATLKGRIAFPKYFTSIESADLFCLEFFTWYNCFHLHSGLDYLTPQSVHEGLQTNIFQQRNTLLSSMRKEHPSRFGTRKKVFAIPETVRLKHRTMMDQAAA